MENPKHMTQIGLPRGNRRIFLEDYVLSYMKQHKSEATVKVALFGHIKKEGDNTKFFIYGAAGILEENYEEGCERIRRIYFSDYRYMGYGELANELPDGFYIETERGTSYIEGYYCFYDDNDAMLNYMVEERENSKTLICSEKKPEHRSTTVRKEPQPINKLKLSVVITFLIMCAVTVRDYLSENNKEDNNSAQVVTESNLVDALQQENMDKEAEEQVSEPDMAQMTDVSAASEEIIEREPVIFEGAEEPEVIETMSAISEPVTEQTETVHIVQKGDTLITISIRYYGNKEQVNAICEANGIEHPDDIKIGQKLILP